MGCGRGVVGDSGPRAAGAGGAGPRVRRCGARTAVVSGRAHPLSSFLCSPNLPSLGSRLRVRVAETCGGGARRGRPWPAGAGWLGAGVFTRSRGSAALPCAAAALCWGAGSRVAKAERPGSPASPAGCPGTPEGRFRPVLGAEAAEEPRLRLPGHLGTWKPARIRGVRGGAGEGARSPSPRCPDAPVASSSAGRWRPGHPPGTVSSRRG